jgi:pyruvate dehydrogenase kinase 2/3/4
LTKSHEYFSFCTYQRKKNSIKISNNNNNNYHQLIDACHYNEQRRYRNVSTNAANVISSSQLDNLIHPEQQKQTMPSPPIINGTNQTTFPPTNESDGPVISSLQSKNVHMQYRALTEEEIERERKLNYTLTELANCTHQTISMRSLIQFGAKITQETLIESCRWLHQELKIRLAKQVKQLNEFPKGLNLMPSVSVVRQWYTTSLIQMVNAVPPTNWEEQLKFSEMLQEIYDRHAPTTISVARGVYELKMEYAFSVFKSINLVDLSSYIDLHKALDNFYINRIGMRMLIGQHLELLKTYLNPDYANENYVGLICKKTSPKLVAQDAVEDAREICMRNHLDAPEVQISGIGLNATFPYVPSHLYYVLFEVLKNSMRAVCEKHSKSNELPPIQIVIADSDNNEDICIRISDMGGGIARSNMEKIWSYLYTTANYQYAYDEDLKEAPLAGLGYGLPLSKVYCQYWGGDIQIQALEGLGTDVYIYLNRRGDTEEPQLT